MTVTATIASTHPRTRTFELSTGHADNGIEYGFAGPDKARLFYLAPFNRRLGRRDTLAVVVLADSIQPVDR